MRILLTLHFHLDPNAGAPGSTLALAQAYTRAGHEVELLSYDDLPRRTPWQAKLVGFPVLVAGRLLASRGFDVVDSSTGDAWLWSLRRPARSNGPILASRSHGLEHREHLEWLRDHREGRVALRRRYFLYHGGERLREVAVSLRRADLALFLNGDDRDYAVERLGVAAERAHVVGFGLHDAFRGQPAPRASTGEGALRIALIARHTTGMGTSYSVPALERLLRRHPALRVSLLGSALPIAAVRADFAAEVRDRLDVVPSYDRAELPRLLAGHEIFVSAKFLEASGNGLVEAMACGLAPVVAAASGPSRIVEHATSGLLVPPRDADATVAAVERLIADPDLRLSLRRNAHASAAKYSWDVAAGERLALYRAALAARRGARARARIDSTV